MRLRSNATLLLHATLYEIKSTTFDGGRPSVSVYKRYPKENMLAFNAPGIDFASAWGSMAKLLEGRIGVPEYWFVEMKVGYFTKHEGADTKLKGKESLS